MEENGAVESYSSSTMAMEVMLRDKLDRCAALLDRGGFTQPFKPWRFVELSTVVRGILALRILDLQTQLDRCTELPSDLCPIGGHQYGDLPL